MNNIRKNELTYAWLKKELKKTYRYYYELMSDGHKRYYKQIFRSILYLEPIVKLPLIDIHECEQIYNYCLLDNPLFFYVNSINYVISPFEIVVNICYSMDAEDIANTLQIIKTTLETVIIDCRFFNELEKEIYIHRYIIKNVRYEMSELLPIHNAHSVFLYKKAACDGISKAAKILLDGVRVHSVVLSGKIIHSNMHNSDRGHAWNIIWIEKKPYHIDFTFDNTLSKGEKIIRYDYFNLSDVQIKKDHTYEDIGVYAVSTNDWFYSNGRYFDKKSAVRDYIKRSIQNRSEYLGFRLPFTSNPEKTIHEIQLLISDVIKANAINTISYRISINKEQMVIYLMFDAIGM